jgi:hypothetical protein
MLVWWEATASTEKHMFGGIDCCWVDAYLAPDPCNLLTLQLLLLQGLAKHL